MGRWVLYHQRHLGSSARQMVRRKGRRYFSGVKAQLAPVMGKDKIQSSAGSLERNRDLGVSLGSQGAARQPFLLQCGMRVSAASRRQQGKERAGAQAWQNVSGEEPRER